MLVQSIGESCGSSVARLPLVPSYTIRCTPGMPPESISGWMIFQSAESIPTKRSFRWRSGWWAAIRERSLLKRGHNPLSQLILHSRPDLVLIQSVSSVRSVTSISLSITSAGDSWGKFESTTSLA